MLTLEGFCPKCYERVHCHSIHQKEEASVKGVSFSFVKYAALCDNCETEVSVPAINDFNEHSFEEAYYREIAYGLEDGLMSLIFSPDEKTMEQITNAMKIHRYDFG